MGARLDGDGASLDPICVSEHATEQFIPQKENALNSDGDKPVTELRLVLDSVDPCNLSGINEDSGEGANAVSRAEMMITVSASPLSELVWAPHSGLSLKCTDCSSSDKSSVLWNTNLGRMIVLPLRSIKGNTNSDNTSTAKGTLGLTQTGFGPENEISKRASSTKSSQSNMDIIPLCISRPTEKKYEVLGINSKEAITDINIEREMGKISPGAKKANTCISGDRKEMAGTCLGQSNEKVTIVIKQGALPEHSSQVPSDEIGNSEWNSKVKGRKEIFLSKDYILKSYDHCKGPILNLITEEDSKLVKALSNSIELPHLDRLKPSAENEVENIRTEENIETTKQNKDIPILDNKLRVESSAASDDRRSLALRKGKGKVLSDTMIEQSQSNGKTTSHESVESSNNCELFSSKKRAWSFEKKIVIGSKKIKRQDSSKKIKRHGSSFMTWISNMTNGFQKFERGENLSLSVMPKTSQRRHGSRDSLSVSHDKNQDQAIKNTGFQSVFRALRGPSLSLQERNSELEESDRKRFLCDSVKTQMADCEGHVKSSNFILPSNKHSTFIPDVTGFPEKYETKFKNCNSGKVSGLLKGVVPYLDSSFLEKPDSQKVKEDSKICAADLSYSKSMTNNNSLWITRFSPKVLNSVQFNTSSNAAVDGGYDSNRVFPCNVEQNNLESGHGQKPEKRTIALGRNLDDYSVGPTSSCNSRRTNVDQKLKSKVSSILPSERSKISEALASAFARRVDALRHIMPSKDEDDVTHETICFFCGLKGHTLRDCSEMGEYDHKDLLKNLKLWDEEEDTSCLCILCFKLNHWAVSCPYSSSRKSLGGESYKKMSEERWNKIPQSDLDGQILHRRGNEVADCQQVTSYAITCGKFLTMDTELNVCSNVVKESSTTGKSNGKHLGSNFENPGLKDNQVSLLCNTKDMSDVPRATFEAIRKLRLSRRDILRWIKSPIPNLRLEGFFLRLRLGKWEEGLGGTGYHVACISGASNESSSRTSKTPISVDIGGFQCSVDCHYVSNHDFNEDELMAWWCAILRGDGKQPSEEQLHIKLQERQKYGF